MLTVQETLVAIDRKADVALALLETEQEVPPEVEEAAVQFARAASTAIDSLSDDDGAATRAAIETLERAGERARRIAQNHLIAGERGLSALQEAVALASGLARDWREDNHDSEG
ncbi:MAG: hypothetical protein GVY13_11025 [Alphaproteobacteria bacterium]|jgi:hypothetical protein|nr:hypothetical protein [Alphaproteobacteria bacterium]